MCGYFISQLENKIVIPPGKRRKKYIKPCQRASGDAAGERTSGEPGEWDVSNVHGWKKRARRREKYPRRAGKFKIIGIHAMVVEKCIVRHHYVTQNINEVFYLLQETRVSRPLRDYFEILNVK